MAVLKVLEARKVVKSFSVGLDTTSPEEERVLSALIGIDMLLENMVANNESCDISSEVLQATVEDIFRKNFVELN